MKRFVVGLLFAIVFCTQFVFAEPIGAGNGSAVNVKYPMFVGAIVLISVLVLLVAVLIFRIRKMKMADKSSGQGDAENKGSEDEGSYELREEILKALKNDEFKMYLQFIVDAKAEKIVYAEALSRWNSPVKGIIPPVKYIGEMESSGLISEHDFYMFERVCRQLQEWNGTCCEDISISCNFTRITLSEENFVEKLKTISQKYDFDKSKLAIEITEDAIEKDREKATVNVKRCKELGFRVYLDDLGGGYTSLVNLCDYPIDVVKIDRDILLKTNTQRGKDLLSGIVALTHSLNMSVICEGVETEEQDRLVKACGCDYIQGWYYSKAMPLEACEEFFDNYKHK